MIKKLIKHGDSNALVIDKPILDLLSINEETELEVSTDGEMLLIKPVRNAVKKINKISDNKKLQNAYEKVVSKYDLALKKLAKN